MEFVACAVKDARYDERAIEMRKDDKIQTLKGH